MVHCGLATMCNCHVAMVTASDSGIKELVYLNEETQMGTIACQLSDNYRILVFNLFGTCTFRDHPSLSPMPYVPPTGVNKKVILPSVSLHLTFGSRCTGEGHATYLRFPYALFTPMRLRCAAEGEGYAWA